GLAWKGGGDRRPGARRGSRNCGGGSRAGLPALLHDQAPGLGHRALDGLPDRPDARRADRRRLGSRAGHHYDDDASRGLPAIVAMMPRALLTATLIALVGCSTVHSDVLLKRPADPSPPAPPRPTPPPHPPPPPP